MSKEGYILTNNHVVEDADRIKVKLAGGKEFDGKIVGRDPKTDLALIKIAGDSDLQPLKLGNSDDLKVGNWVVAVGSPFGLEQTVTAGIVSAKGRVIGSGPYDNFIQTDASINPGNSGGPLFNMDGKVIGINAAIIAQGQGIGFAIPINMANRMLPDLKTKGKVTRGWLGVSIQDITEEIAKNLNHKERAGALIAEVFEGDPADKAGLKAGDIIIEVNGKEVKDSHELLVLVADFHVGEKVEIKALQDGKEKTFQVIVAERTEKAEMAAAGTANNFGMTVQEITPEIAKHLGMSKKTGVIVADVKEGSSADEAGIRPQDVILQVNRIKVNSIKDFEKEIAKADNKDGFSLLIKRGRFPTTFVPIRP
jgi:serine protease Do